MSKAEEIYRKDDVTARLKLSYGRFRAIYPIIRAADGRIAEGRHRHKVNKKWPSVTRKDLKTEKDIILFRIHAHECRRRISFEERQEEIQKLAGILLKEGVKKERVCAEIAKITPFSDRYIEYLIGPEWKMKTVPKRKSRNGSTSDSTHLDSILHASVGDASEPPTPLAPPTPVVVGQVPEFMETEFLDACDITILAVAPKDLKAGEQFTLGHADLKDVTLRIADAKLLVSRLQVELQRLTGG